ncbi:MAG: diguanylate cyclase, partial [Pseudomonadota bacterium]
MVIRTLAFMLTLCLCGPVWGQADPNPPVHPLPTSGVMADLKGLSFYRPDPDHELSPEALFESDEGFLPFDPTLNEEAPSLWLKLVLIAPADGQPDYALRVGRRLFSRFELFTLDPSGQIERRSATVTEAVDAESVGREYVFPLTIEPGTRATILINVETIQQSLQPLILAVEDGAGFAASRANSYLFYGLVFGVLLALIFHNFALYLNLRQQGHLFYVLAMTCTLLLLGIDSGMLQNFLLPDALLPWVGRLNILFAVMLVISIYLFFQAFVDGMRLAPKLTKACRNAAVILAVLGPVVLVAPTNLFLLVTLSIQLINSVVMILLIAASLIAARKGSVEGSIFLAAWSIYVINAIVRSMLSLDFMANPLSEQLMYLAAVVEASILALGLSYRVRVLYERHATALKEQHKAAMLANSDPLTGAYNRRFLQSYLGTALKDIDADEFDRSVLILDLDHFKDANDEYGHAAGDAILRDLVRRCQSRLAEDDVMCRLGGDEFVIITSDQAEHQGLELAERLMETFRKQPFTFEGQSMPVTTSIGVVTEISTQSTVS